MYCVLGYFIKSFLNFVSKMWGVHCQERDIIIRKLVLENLFIHYMLNTGLKG